MTASHLDEPSGMLPQVVDGATIPAASVTDPAASLSAQLPPTALPPTFQPPSATAALPSADLQTPAEAADSDLIEKEWVDKAKQIVDHTSTDPYTQQEQLSKMKVDYLKKRYNKDLGAI